MEDKPAQDADREDPIGETPKQSGYGLSRRDFLAVTALTAGSLLLLLGPYFKQAAVPGDEALEVPPDFKRFILSEQSPTVASEEMIVALGSQCPDLDCVLWWVDDQQFRFFESVDQLNELYVVDGDLHFYWLD